MSDQEEEARTALVVSLQTVRGHLDLLLLDWKLSRSRACLILYSHFVHSSQPSSLMKGEQIHHHYRFGSWLHREQLLVTLRRCSVGLADVEAAAAVVVDRVSTMKAAELVAVWTERS